MVEFERRYTPEFAPDSEAEAAVGNTLLVRAAWGEHVSTIDLTADLQEQGLSPQMQRRIEGTGFSGGYHLPPETNTASEEYQEKQAMRAGELAYRVTEPKGWKGIDVLIIASASSDREIALPQAAKYLKNKNIGVGSLRFYGQACNGFFAGVIDSLKLLKNFPKTRVVVVGIESLSGSFINWKNPQMRATFGVGAGAASFTPADIELVYSRGPIVEYDEEKVIAIPRVYNLPSDLERADPPPWYEFVKREPDGKLVSITYQDAEDYFAYTTTGSSILAIPESETGKGEMDGKKTYGFFKRGMPDLLVELQKVYEEEFQEFYPKLGPAIYHPANEPVVFGISREYILQALLKKGLPQRGNNGFNAKRLSRMGFLERQSALKEKGVEFPEIRYKWVMDKTGFNNISAATAAVNLIEMIKQGLLKPNVLTPYFSMGVGSVRQAGLLIFKQQI